MTEILCQHKFGFLLLYQSGRKTISESKLSSLSRVYLKNVYERTMRGYNLIYFKIQMIVLNYRMEYI